VRRLALLVAVIAASASLPASAPAARRHAPRCGKHVVCRGAVHARSSALPFAWRTGAPRAGGPGPVTLGPTGSESRTAGGESAPPPPPLPPTPTGNPRFLQVRTDDADPSRLHLTPSRASVPAGSVKVEFFNATAQDPHDLHFERGSDDFQLAAAGAGEIKTRVVTLTAGTWKLYCGIAGHEALGMKAQISVVPATPS
jgi:plastocyanin